MTKIVSRPQIPLGTFEIVLNVTWPAQQWRNEVPVNVHIHNSFPIWQFLSSVRQMQILPKWSGMTICERSRMWWSCLVRCRLRQEFTVLATMLFRDFLVIILICWPCLGENPIWYDLNSQLAIEYGELQCGLLQTKHILNLQLKYERWENEYFHLLILR